MRCAWWLITCICFCVLMMQVNYQSWCIGLAGIQPWLWIAFLVAADIFGRQGITPQQLHQKITGECWIPCAISTSTQRQQESGKGFITPIPITGITAGWNVMASVSGTHAFCNWHQALRVAPSDTHDFASNTCTKAKAVLGAIGVHGCWHVRLKKKAEAVNAGRTRYTRTAKNYLLPLTFASIKIQKTGIKLWWDFEEQMAYAMVAHVYSTVKRLRR